MWTHRSKNDIRKALDLTRPQEAQAVTIDPTNTRALQHGP
jgi:hypothetical protein